MSTPDHKLEALKEAAHYAKSDMALLGVPLALLVAQLKFLISVEETSIKVIATIGLASFFVGLVLAWLLWSSISTWYAKELLCKDGHVEDGLGASFLHAVDPSGKAFCEETYLRIRKLFHPVILLCLVVGYSCLAVLLMLLVWSAP